MADDASLYDYVGAYILYDPILLVQILDPLPNTLRVLQAIIHDIPIVSWEWVEQIKSKHSDQLLTLEDHFRNFMFKHKKEDDVLDLF